MGVEPSSNMRSVCFAKCAEITLRGLKIDVLNLLGAHCADFLLLAKEAAFCFAYIFTVLCALK